MQLSIDNTVILDDLFFEVAPGEILGVLGPNGSGKSSLLRCITGIWQGDRGTVWMDGSGSMQMTDVFALHLVWCSKIRVSMTI